MQPKLVLFLIPHTYIKHDCEVLKLSLCLAMQNLTRKNEICYAAQRICRLGDPCSSQVCVSVPLIWMDERVQILYRDGQPVHMQDMSLFVIWMDGRVQILYE